MYFFDHLPPHFHAVYNEYEELIEIRSLETYAGYLPSKHRKKVITWASDKQGFLMEKWEELNPGS